MDIVPNAMGCPCGTAGLGQLTGQEILAAKIRRLGVPQVSTTCLGGQHFDAMESHMPV